jgi:subtilisin family serine protease
MVDGLNGAVDFIEMDTQVQSIPEQPTDEDGMNVSIQSHASWGLKKIGQVPGSSRSGGKGVHIYVLDTGVRVSHADFNGRAIPTLDCTRYAAPWECKGNRDCAADRQSHGTHCAGTAAGATYGVAPDATIHGVKVLGDDGSGSNAWILSALDWIKNFGERPAVASMSLGGPGTSPSAKVAYENVIAAGVTIVVAAGNDNDDACGYNPAFIPSVITVGSTDMHNRRSSFSNYGRCVDLFAPGTDIVSAGHQFDSQSATMSGTSMACPHVAGAAALVLSADPNLSPAQVLEKILGSAKRDEIDLAPWSGKTNTVRDSVNLLLDVRSFLGGSGGGGSPSPSPVPNPVVPTPTPTPNSPTCPRGMLPSSRGYCECAQGLECYQGGVYGCKLFDLSGRHTTLFNPGCADCICKATSGGGGGSLPAPAPQPVPAPQPMQCPEDTWLWEDRKLCLCKSPKKCRQGFQSGCQGRESNMRWDSAFPPECTDCKCV